MARPGGRAACTLRLARRLGVNDPIVIIGGGLAGLSGARRLHEGGVRRGVSVCGDHREAASIHGTMGSGRRAADSCLEDLG